MDDSKPPPQAVIGTPVNQPVFGWSLVRLKRASRIIVQDDNLKVSQTAVKDYYNIKGHSNKTLDKGNVNVAFIIQTNANKG